DGFTRGAARPGVVASSTVVVHRAHDVASTLEVRGKLGGEFACARAESCLESIGYCDMQACPPRGRQTVVQRGAVERMPERIATHESAVGPGFVARIPQEQTTSRELGTARLDCLGVLTECCGDGRGAELLAHRTGNLQDLTLAAAQVLELQLDQAPQILRNSRCNVLEPTGEGPCALPLNQQATCDEIVSDIDDEERIAFRSLV